VSQKFALYGNLSVRENLEFFGGAYGLHGQALRTRVQRAWIARVRPGACRPSAACCPAATSSAWRWPPALLHEPDILFLDEPTSGIDPHARRSLLAHHHRACQAAGVTVIITTHFMEEAEYCDRIAIQDAGEACWRWARRGRCASRRAVTGANDMNSAFIAIVEQGRADRHAKTVAA
jgi:ABC-2 type transport system ATP-binding protein